MDIHQTFLFVTIFISVVLNIFVLFLIVFCSSERLGSYKYLLFAYTFNAILYSTCESGILLNWYVPREHAGYMAFSSVGVFSRPVQIWLMLAFIGLFHMNLFIVCWSFLYRLTIFSQSFFFKKRSKVLALGLFTAFLEAVTVFNGWLIQPTERSDEEYRRLVLNITGRQIEEVAYVGGPFMYADGVNVNLFVCLSINGAIGISINYFIVHCWLGIRRCLANKKLSTATVHLHYRLYVLLTLQSLFPILFNCTPFILSIVFSALHLNLGDYILLMGDVMNLAQIMDPICILFFVTDYKRVVLKVILGRAAYERRISPTVLSKKSQSQTGVENSQKIARETDNVIF